MTAKWMHSSHTVVLPPQTCSSDRPSERALTFLHALSSVVSVDMDVVCFGIFANVYWVIFASKSETAGFTGVHGAAFNFCFCLKSYIGSFQCCLV